MAWFELSGSFMTPMLASGLLLIVSGVAVGVAAGWWFNGQWWLWPLFGSAFAIAGIVAITWLMETKPF